MEVSEHQKIGRQTLLWRDVIYKDVKGIGVQVKEARRAHSHVVSTN